MMELNSIMDVFYTPSSKWIRTCYKMVVAKNISI